MLLTVFSRVMYLCDALRRQTQQYNVIMQFIHVRAADGWVADASEKCTHGREGDGASEAIAHSSRSHKRKIPKRKPVFFGISRAEENYNSSAQRHQKPPCQGASPLLQRPLVVCDAPNHERKSNFKRKQSNRDFGEGILAHSSSLIGGARVIAINKADIVEERGAWW